MKKYFILFPVYNDWTSLWKLSKEINEQIKGLDAKFSFLFINDASTEKKPNFNLTLDKIDSVKVINMNKNQLSGRCIATGLKYIYENEEFDHVIVMDSDGEDKPECIIEIHNKNKTLLNKTVVVERLRRNENIFYKLFYKIHKITTAIFAGKLIKFGNFVCLPKDHVHKLIQEKNLWNAFSSTIAKVIEDRIFIKSDRGKRYFGPSKTSYFRLIHHAFTIMSVFYRVVFLRILIISSVYLFFIYDKILILNLLPLVLILIFLTIILLVSKRANIKELNNSLKNIKDVEVLK